MDSYPDARFVVSGSAVAVLKMKSQESGAGRFTDFILPPMMFYEFVKFRREKGELDEFPVSDIEICNREFIQFGGFPEAIFQSRTRDDLEQYVARDIIDKVLMKDLPSVYGLADSLELNRLFNVLAINTGREVSYAKLSHDSGVSQNTLKKYVDYLEAAFLIHRVYRVDQNARKFKKQDRFKVYLTNPSLHAALFGETDPEEAAFGHLVETAIMSQFCLDQWQLKPHYAAWKGGEVDAVFLRKALKPEAAFEIKWSNRAQSDLRETANLLEFARRNNVEETFLLTRSTSFENKADGVTIKAEVSRKYLLVTKIFNTLLLEIGLSGNNFLNGIIGWKSPDPPNEN